MKLRARFPQLGLARPEAATPARSARRRTFWPTSPAGVTALPDAADAPAVPAPSPEPRPVPLAPPDYSSPVDWPSTVAAWRSTTGKPGDRT